MSYKKELSFLIAALLPSVGLALGIRIVDQDAQATARGDAFVATADNPSAIFYNPAGMSQLKGQNVQIGGYLITLKSTFTSPTGSTYDTKAKLLGVPQLYYTTQIPDSRYAVGLGVYSPYGLGLEWKDDTPFRNLAKNGNIKYITVNPAFSLQVTRQFSLGFGLTFNYAEADLSRGIFPAPGFGDEFKFNGSGTTFGFNAGALWQPAPRHSFGVRYYSGTDINLGGDASFGVPGFSASDDSANATFHFPQFLTVGYSFRPTPEWNIEFNADWTDWDSLNTVTLHQSAAPGGDVPLPFNWNSSFMYELGVTHYFSNGYQASAGYIFSENSVPDASFNPAIPDSNRHIFSVGFGRKYHSFDWNLTYQLAYGPSRVVSGSQPEPIFGNRPADGSYQFLSHALSFSLGYSF